MPSLPMKSCFKSAGVVLDVFAQALQNGAVGGDLEAENQVTRHAVADDAVAAGIVRDVAADGATAARAEVERKHQAVLLDPSTGLPASSW
nr:hypothetical protein [Bradyrhizobium australiense]